MAASLSPVPEAALVIAVLLVMVAGTQLPGSLIVAGLTPAPVLILILWIVGLALIGGPGKHLPWANSGEGARQSTAPPWAPPQ